MRFRYISNNKYLEIYNVIESLGKQLQMELAGQIVMPGHQNILLLSEIKQGMTEAVGNKAYNLSRVASLPNAQVPSGFVVTIAGFRKYLAYNNLFDKIERLLNASRQEGQAVESVSHTIRLWILGGDIPPELRRDILKAIEKICPQSPESAFYSVRSSAIGEDGEMSYAGLHDSFLNVPFRELLSSFKKVLAGMYNPTSLAYRISRQVPTTDMAMAVLYQNMVSSRVAGVAYTIDPNAPRREICVLGASWGLGKVVVEGRNAVDTYRVSRNPPYAVVASRKGLMSSLTRTQTAAVSGNPLAGLNVAVLGDTYLNLSLRVGYHFTVVDASLGPELEKNSVFFRFIGGATDISRRSRRAALLMSILEKIGFKVEGKGDLVIARAICSKMEQGEKYLYLVGRLIGFARQLDILMTDDSAVDLYYQRFMADSNINPSGPYI